MASSAHDLVGLEASSRDDYKLGRIKDVISDPESASDYIVIRCSRFRDLVVPASVVVRGNDGVTVPFSRSFLDVAPRVAKKGRLSSEERARLERFYHPVAA